MDEKRIIGVIPARYGSSRFPGKPLAKIHGKSMIERVYTQASKLSDFAQLVVATDDERIYQHVLSFGGHAIMTASTHRSGTERCAEVAKKLLPKADIVVNIQGDEPFIQPSQIQLLIDMFVDNKAVQIVSLAKAITTEQELLDKNVVKVVMGIHNQALYFSRLPIPFVRSKTNGISSALTYYKHIGMYAYRADVLAAISRLPVHALECAESLEQLRWLAYNYSIRMAITTEQALSVDTPQDLERITALYLG